MASLERFDFRAVLHDQPDIVEALEQALLRIRIDIEGVMRAVGAGDFLRVKINADGGTRLCLQLRAQFRADCVGQHHRQHAVLQFVTVVNVAERRRDDAADAKIPHDVDRRFARGAAAEIDGGDQNLCVAKRRLV